MRKLQEQRKATAAEAAKHAGRSVAWIYDRVADGRLPADQTAGRMMVRLSDVDRLLAHEPKPVDAAVKRQRAAAARRRRFHLIVTPEAKK